jgi:predicted nucleic acid-binding protein
VRVLLLDTGPLIALLDRSESYHEWATQIFQQPHWTILTCDAVLTEAIYLLARQGLPRRTVLDLLLTDRVRVAFDPNAEAAAVAGLLDTYADTPMDYADACLVRMSELFSGSTVLTLDSDFFVYRRLGRDALSVLHPTTPSP